MKKKIIFLGAIFFVIAGFSGCIDDSGSDDSEAVTPTIDCEAYNQDNSDNIIFWNVTNVEDGPVKWSECSWKLINSADSKNDDDATVDFTDVDNDGNISKNDYFTVSSSDEGSYSFKIIYEKTDGIAFASNVMDYHMTSPPVLAVSQENTVVSTGGYWVNFTVVSASASAKWSDLKIIVNETNLGTPTLTDTPNSDSCGYNSTSSALIAGDKIFCHVSEQLISGDCSLEVIHFPSNSIILQKTIT